MRTVWSLFLLALMSVIEVNAQNEKLPTKENLWVFMMAGQSNMAGRGVIEPQDTIVNTRVFTINEAGEIVLAQEPLHFYEPKMAGLDCGMSFATELLAHVPDSICILMVPTAVGGSSIKRWLDDKPHRGVNLQSNFIKRMNWAKNYGEIKAVLWHQGESDVNEGGVLSRKDNLSALFEIFRQAAANDNLPIIVGELGSYSKDPLAWRIMNEASRQYVASDSNCTIFSTSDLKDKGDKLHFNSAGQRELGKRFAQEYMNEFKAH
ncbi:MAG: sialate O-acetylesterase [Mangrovibacterium sp.]